jgi:hypothetical protein
MIGHFPGKPQRIFMRLFQVAVDAACSSDEPQAALAGPPLCAANVPRCFLVELRASG